MNPAQWLPAWTTIRPAQQGRTDYTWECRHPIHTSPVHSTQTHPSSIQAQIYLTWHLHTTHPTWRQDTTPPPPERLAGRVEQLELVNQELIQALEEAVRYGTHVPQTVTIRWRRLLAILRVQGGAR